MPDRFANRARRSGHGAWPPATRTVTVRGEAVPVLELGSAAAPALVLVAGLAGSGLWWRRATTALAAGGRRVVLVDLPGFGTLGGHRRLLPIADQAAWLAELVEAGGWGGERAEGGAGGGCGGGSDRRAAVDLVGYSLGGSVCARVVAARPELARRLVLVAPGGVPSRRGALAELGSLLHMGWLAGPWFWPTLLRDVRRAGLRALLGAGQDVRADDATALLPQIAAPTLLIWGRRDTLVPRGDIDLIAAGLPDVRLEVFPGVGHIPMAECPEALAAAILGFVA